MIFSKARVFVIPGPREKFSETEINHMKKYLEVSGGPVTVCRAGGASWSCSARAARTGSAPTSTSCWRSMASWSTMTPS